MPLTGRVPGRVHVVGNACIDTSFQLRTFPEPGETVNAKAMSEGLGGKGANQAVAAARTGAAVTLWAAVGEDAEAGRIATLLAGHGVADARLFATAAASDRSVVLLDDSGENRIVSAVPAASAFDPAAQPDFAAALAPGDLLVMQNNLAPEATAACLALAGRRGLTRLLNASPLATGTALSLDGVELVVANAGEARALTGEAEPDRALARLVALGAAAAVVTLGSRGAMMRTASGETLEVAAPAARAVDTSGAGDVFCGTLAGLIASGMAWEAALRVAVRAASYAVERPGTAASGPGFKEIGRWRAEAEGVA